MTNAPDSNDHLMAGGVLSIADAVPIDRTPQVAAYHELGAPEHLVASGHYVLAAALRELLESDGASPVVACEDALWRYIPAEGVWHRLTPDEERQAMHCLDGTRFGPDRRRLTVSRAMVDGTLTELRALHGVANPDHFSRPEIGIQFTDGFFSVSHGLVENSPDHRARYAYPWEYATAAPATRFMDALAQWFDGDEDAPEKATTLQEFAGCCLLGIATRYQKCLMLKDSGHGASGKSTFAKIVSAAMPPGSVVSVDLQDFNEQNRALLAGKLLNMASDLPSTDVLATAPVKKAISGELTHAKAVYTRPFSYTPTAGLLFDTNGLPGTRDLTESFWRRFIVVHFGQRFEGTARVVGLDQLIIDEELPGVVAWMLEGALRAIEGGDISSPPSHVAEMSAWKREANIVASWVHEKCTIVDGRGQRHGELFEAFNRWRRTQEYRALGARRFRERLMQIVGPPTILDGNNHYAIRIGKGEEGPF
jgi:putative DNA primase/helicase